MTGTLELVAPRALLVPRPRVRLELQPGDRVIAEIGDVVRAGDVLAERIRDARLVEVVLPRHAADQGVPLPGTWLPGEHAQPGRRAGTPAGELLFQHGGRRRLATGPHPDHLSAPADGRLVEVHAGVALVLEIGGPGLVATELLGEPHAGRLVLLPDESDPHLALDVALAGAVVVVPGRVDAEALTRAQEDDNMGYPVVHFEITGTDSAALHKYYGELFDWQINADNPMGYGLVSREENLNAEGVGIGGDLLERAGQAGRVARELAAGGVGQVLAPPRYGELH